MERKKVRNSSGITLIALVISIIVMLILAGVSINATIGDNGVIGKAQDTIFLNSCAYLEEYFNQLYATCTIDGASEGDTPLHTIMNNGYQHYFFSTSEGTCLKKNYINEETGESQTLVLYLVKKEQLPTDIQAQLTGGEGLESRDYRKLKGCYGITSDLQAYYCEDGLETLLGLSTSDLNADSPDIMFADENSVLAQVVNGGTAPIMNQGLKSIKKLTIDSIEELSILADFSRFINLTDVYFSGLTINTLSGIEGAINSLTYIKFTNCNVQDYSALNGLTNLTQLYLVKPAGMNEEIVRLGSTDKGIASGEFSKLQYFGIVGEDLYLNSSTTNYSTTRYGITDISSLANFSDVTKKAIKYMNLQNLQLTSIASLVDFTNIYMIRLESNALSTFDGIQNIGGLTYLIAPHQYSTTTKSYTLGMNEGTVVNNTDALKYIYKNSNLNTSLYYVDLRNNAKLKYVDSLSECTAIKYLYLVGCTNLQNVNTIGTVIGKCGTNYSLDGSYGNNIITDTIGCIQLSGTITVSEFEQLKNNTNLTHLSLKNLTITDNSGTALTASTTPTYNEEVNNILATCTNLQYLQLYGLSNLTTIDFVGSGKVTKLIELDLRNSGVTNLTNLNTYGTAIKALSINNTGIQLKDIQDTMNRCRKSSRYWLDGSDRGLNILNWDLLKQLEECTELKYFYSYDFDMVNITKGKTLDLSNTKIENWDALDFVCPVKFPQTIKTIYIDIGALPAVGNPLINLVDFSAYNCGAYTSKEKWKTFLDYLAQSENLSKLYIGADANFDCEMLTSLSALTKLTRFNYYGAGHNVSSSPKITSINGIENLQYLQEFNCLYFPTLRDVLALGNCINLTKVVIDSAVIDDISSFSNLTKLTYLDLDNNSIADIYPLMNCKKLETLYIQNNALTDLGYYKDASGRSIGYEVMDVFYDLNYEKQGSLKNLYMSGNTFDDTEILWDLDWKAGNGGIFKPTT